MKEIEIKDSDKITINTDVEVKKQLTLIKSERKISGLRLFEYNTITKEIKEAEFLLKDYLLDFTKPDPAKDLLSRLKVKHNPNCKYIQAINKKNALKKLNKI